MHLYVYIYITKGLYRIAVRYSVPTDLVAAKFSVVNQYIGSNGGNKFIRTEENKNVEKKKTKNFSVVRQYIHVYMYNIHVLHNITRILYMHSYALLKKKFLSAILLEKGTQRV